MMTDDILSSCSLAARGLNQRMLNAAKRLAGVKAGEISPAYGPSLSAQVAASFISKLTVGV
ncbi:hypothetical protein ACJJVE_21260 [Klebsiella quasipneumoniae]